MERPAGRFFMLFIEFRSPSSDRPLAGMHPPHRMLLVKYCTAAIRYCRG